MGFLRQTWTLVKKNLLLNALRRWFSTSLRAIILPIVFMLVISYIRNFFLPPSAYGFGTSRPIRNLAGDVLSSGSVQGREIVVFVNNGFLDGQIEELINNLSAPLETAGADVRVLSSNDEMNAVCRSSLWGTSRCYGAVTFQSSPTEGENGVWAYTVRVDFSLGFQVFVSNGDNAAQLYSLPLVHAIDSGIASISGTSLPDDMLEYPFTDQTSQEREDQVQTLFMGALINYLGLVFFIGVCGITYHLTGHMASERELGISQLIDSMVPARHQLYSQVIRLISAHLAFDLIYLPSWIGIGFIVKYLIFYRTSAAVTVFYHMLFGFALSGYSSLGGTFFRKSQVSGITVTIFSLVLAIIAQLAVPRTAINVAFLSFIFPPINYVYFTIYLAYFERDLTPANLARPPPGSPWEVRGSVFVVAIVVQIFIYPILATISEWTLYGTGNKNRNILFDKGDDRPFSIILQGFSKQYAQDSWWRALVVRLRGRRKKMIKAVDGLDLRAPNGQMVVLLGANGSGKSTTLHAISGMEPATLGSIELDGTGGLGLCPQKNVLWEELTVVEHINIFNSLKAYPEPDTTTQVKELVRACDLSHKEKKRSKTLSGGQKRKLQLALAFTGGSKVCCIDEVSSGLDPLSRRKIWEILLAERGKRTFLFTTHALDEADALADHIVILSKGLLKVQGSVVELKHKYGGGYRLQIPRSSISNAALFTDVLQSPYTVKGNNIVVQVQDSAKASAFADELEQRNVKEVQISGPTIEDVFLKVSEEGKEEVNYTSISSPNLQSSTTHNETSISPRNMPSDDDDAKPLELYRGKGASFIKQTWILFHKRLLILRRNYFPYVFALLVPILTSGLVTLFLTGWPGINCDPDQLSTNLRTYNLPRLDYFIGLLIPVGPSSRFSSEQLTPTYRPFLDRLSLVPNYDRFNGFIEQNFRDVSPGGFYLGNGPGDPPTLAYVANGGLQYSALAKSAFDSYLMNTTIDARFSNFALPLNRSAGDSLQLILYIGFAMCAYTAFFSLYPTFERLRNIRALHLSNGIRSGPLWLAYLLFDGIFILIVSIVVVALLVGLSDVWYQPGYLFVVMFLYGITSALLSYAISLFASSQLAAFAFAAGGQAVLLLIYFIVYMVLLTFSGPDELIYNLNVVQYTYGLITPSGNLLRALLLTLNQSQILCRGQTYITYPGDITIYGSPILYLVLQAFGLYGLLVWHDSGFYIPAKKKKEETLDEEKETDAMTDDVAAEVARAKESSNGLRVLNLTKNFNKESAISNISFSVRPDDVFALLGPNGAGKSTTISLVRGELRPSTNTGDIYIENISVRADRTAGRRHLGVCPQFDAIDQLTVAEHLAFYARACGVSDVAHNVARVVAAVGLAAFRDRLAAALSGGNKRKLSLGIAVIGNPSVLLLDEPSSGMDAVAKRAMWRVLRIVRGGRALVVTTHSMEEVAALANRAGIMAKRMLAVGTTEDLRRRHGDGYYVHFVHNRGSRVTSEEVIRVENWVRHYIPEAEMDGVMLHGQLKFLVPKGARVLMSRRLVEEVIESEEQSESLTGLLRLLEEHKDELLIEYYSVTQTTLEDVFLNIVSKHKVAEEETKVRERTFLSHVRR